MWLTPGQPIRELVKVIRVTCDSQATSAEMLRKSASNQALTFAPPSQQQIVQLVCHLDVGNVGQHDPAKGSADERPAM